MRGRSPGFCAEDALAPYRERAALTEAVADHVAMTQHEHEPDLPSKPGPARVKTQTALKNCPNRKREGPALKPGRACRKVIADCHPEGIPLFPARASR